MRHVHILAIAAQWLLLPMIATGADWPQFRNDAGRTAASREELPVDLHLQWTRELPHPRPAFPDEVRLRYDVTYEPVVLGDIMFVPSMVNDSLTALDVHTGAERWRFFTGGPVRFAPVAWRDNVYCVSDDGYLYCVNATSGELRWRFRGLPADRSDRTLLGNQRLISLYPARGGPVLADGRIYFAAGLWPANGVFVHALDAQTGEVVWSNTDSHQIPKANMDHGIAQDAGLTPQGYLAIVGDKLVIPCGAQLPALLDLETGRLEPYCMGWGGRIGLPKGSWFVAGSGNVLSHSGDLYDMSQPSQERFKDSRGREDFKSQLYLGGLRRLRIDPTNQRALGEFRMPVLTQETLYVNDGGVVAYDLTAGKIAERDSTDVSPYRKDDQYPDTTRVDFAVKWRLPTNGQVQIKAGPFLFTAGSDSVQAIRIPDAGGQAEVVWNAQIQGTPHRLLAAAGRLFVVTRSGHIHAFGPDQLAEPIVHRSLSEVESPADQWAETAAEMLRVSQVQDGYALVLGFDSGRLVEELLRQSDLYVIAVDTDAGQVDQLRRRLDRAGLYGTRASVHECEPTAYPLPPYLASLIVSESLHADGGTLDRDALEDVLKSLRPYGGCGCLAVSGDKPSELEAAIVAEPLDGISVRRDGRWVVATRSGPLPGAGDWSHPLADAANTGATTDRFVKTPLGLLWFDGALRWHRKPGSIEVRVAGGRILIKGQELHALDVYTGRVIWQADLPFPHNPGDQIVATDDAIYVTSGKVCVVVDPASGKITRRFALPDDLPGPWANLRVFGQYLIGQSGPYVVCCDRSDGQVRWRHQCDRATLSIAVGGGRVFCAELVNKRRGEAASAATRTRAMNMKTGEVLWEIDSGSAIRYSEAYDLLVTAKGIYKGVDGASTGDTSGFDRMHGNQACGLLSLVDDKLLWGTVTSYAAYDLLSGEEIDDAMTWVRRGCTGLRASTNLITTRYRGNCAYIDLDSREITPLWNVRPACNNNLFPADGILNIPCLTGGCECNYTPASQAYAPMSVIER